MPPSYSPRRYARAYCAFLTAVFCHPLCLVSGEEVCGCSSEQAVACRQAGAWWLAESDNFQVCSLDSGAQAKDVARQCEQFRANMTTTWQGRATAWRPKCQVVLHRTIRDYVCAVGRGSEATHGSSLITPRVGTVAARRIDLRTDVHDVLTAALPHELFHVVIVDSFREREAPLWFDEGAALLYDPQEKQRLHERDYLLGIQRGDAFPVAELMRLDAYPSADRWPVFYGQSAAAVRLLLSRDTPQRLLTCIERSQEVGIGLALRENYSSSVLRELELASLSGAERRSLAAPLTQLTFPQSLALNAAAIGATY
jgi:hypothetical protein